MKLKKKCNGYLCFDDDSVWNDPAKIEDLIWTLKYGNVGFVEKERDASFIIEYVCLLNHTNKRRNEICNAIKAAIKEGNDV